MTVAERPASTSALDADVMFTTSAWPDSWSASPCAGHGNRGSGLTCDEPMCGDGDRNFASPACLVQLSEPQDSETGQAKQRQALSGYAQLASAR